MKAHVVSNRGRFTQLLRGVLVITLGGGLGPACAMCAVPNGGDAGALLDAGWQPDAASGSDGGRVEGDGGTGEGGADAGDGGTDDGGWLCTVETHHNGECTCDAPPTTDAGCAALEQEILLQLVQGRRCDTRYDCEWVLFEYLDAERSNDCRLYVANDSDACEWERLNTQWQEASCYDDPMCGFVAPLEPACVDGRCVVCQAPHGSCAGGECADFGGGCPDPP